MTFLDGEKRKEKLINLLTKLKKINHFYQISDEERRGKLIENSQFIIDDLVGMGYERVFIETLLVGGKDFLDSFYKENKEELGLYEHTKLIFG